MKQVIERSEITVVNRHAGGGLFRWFYSYTVTLEDGTVKTYTGDDCTEILAMRNALREFGKLSEKGVEDEPDAPPIAGLADREREAQLDAERVTWEMKHRSTRRIDAGRVPISDSPLFGGPAQGSLF